MVDQVNVVKTVQQYADAVLQAFQPEVVILYCSYAKGSAREDSDIDVAVVFNGFQGDWLKASAKLWKLRRNISDDIEPILLDHTNDESGFLREVLRTGRVIYRA